MPCCFAMEHKIAEPQKISSIHNCPTCLSFQVRGTKGERLHFECSWSGSGSWHFGSAHTCRPFRHRPPGFTPFSAHPAEVLKPKQMGSPPGVRCHLPCKSFGIAGVPLPVLPCPFLPLPLPLEPFSHCVDGYGEGRLDQCSVAEEDALATGER